MGERKIGEDAARIACQGVEGCVRDDQVIVSARDGAREVSAKFLIARRRTEGGRIDVHAKTIA